MTVIPLQQEWNHNVRLVKCLDDVVKPCPRCKHHFGEHNMDGDCLHCLRLVERDLGKHAHSIMVEVGLCGVNMHDAWPDLVPSIA